MVSMPFHPEVDRCAAGATSTSVVAGLDPATMAVRGHVRIPAISCPPLATVLPVPSRYNLVNTLGRAT